MGSGYLDIGLRVSRGFGRFGLKGYKNDLKAWTFEQTRKTASTFRPSCMAHNAQKKNRTPDFPAEPPSPLHPCALHAFTLNPIISPIPKTLNPKPSTGAREERRPRSAPHLGTEVEWLRVFRAWG